MNELGKKEMPEAFMAYVHEWNRLANEYDHIPSWRFFKGMKNIRQREKLTRAYTKKMKEWGII